MSPTLYGLEISVYVRIARLVALEKGVALALETVDPFAEGGPPDWYLAMQPFGKIPALRHGELTLYETQAIARYLDEAFDGPALQPADPVRRARMTQVAGIVDSYAYRPMVWGLFVASRERPADPAAFGAALRAAERALEALEALAEGPWLLGDALSLADMHLAPVVRYLVEVPQGRTLLAAAPTLTAWWDRCRAREGWAALLGGEGP